MVILINHGSMQQEATNAKRKFMALLISGKFCKANIFAEQYKQTTGQNPYILY